MKWLLWREYRLNRLIVITGVVLLVLPYLFLLVGELWQHKRVFANYDEIAGVTIGSLILSQLTAALLGGNAIAGERADRSAEFMVYLPVSRARRFASKMILSASATAVYWGANLFVLWFLDGLLSKGHAEDWVKTIPPIAMTNVMIYGVSWGLSSLRCSPVIAVGGGLFSPLLIWLGLIFGADAFELPALEKNAGTIYSMICAPLGVVSFALGTWYFLTRVEP